MVGGVAPQGAYVLQRQVRLVINVNSKWGCESTLDFIMRKCARSTRNVLQAGSCVSHGGEQRVFVCCAFGIRHFWPEMRLDADLICAQRAWELSELCVYFKVILFHETAKGDFF